MELERRGDPLSDDERPRHPRQAERGADGRCGVGRLGRAFGQLVEPLLPRKGRRFRYPVASVWPTERKLSPFGETRRLFVSRARIPQHEPGCTSDEQQAARGLQVRHHSRVALWRKRDSHAALTADPPDFQIKRLVGAWSHPWTMSVQVASVVPRERLALRYRIACLPGVTPMRVTLHSRRIAFLPPAGGKAYSVRSEVPKRGKLTWRPSNQRSHFNCLQAESRAFLVRSQSP